MPAHHPTDLRERVFEFACAVVLFSCDLSDKPGVARQIAWQLADAATSAGSNLEEAKAAYSRRDFASKNAIALKEMRESRYWLRLIVRCNLAPKEIVQPLLTEASELTAMLTSGMKRLHPVAWIFSVLSCSVLSCSVLTFQF
jgi:four helix bundle protein